MTELTALAAQMFHTGWKGKLLPPRDIRLFMTDTRKHAVLYWRYKKTSRRGGAAAGRGDLGAEDRRVSMTFCNQEVYRRNYKLRFLQLHFLYRIMKHVY